MLAVGDRIVYPMHGPGVVSAIEENEYKGNMIKYIVLKMVIGEMIIKIPVDNFSNKAFGFRPPIERDEVEAIAQLITSDRKEDHESTNWNSRLNVYLAKLKTGVLKDVAEVLRVLIKKERSKKISTGERRLLNSAKQILLAEIAIVTEQTHEDVGKWFDKLIEESIGGQ